MISRAELEILAKRKTKKESPILSVYLSHDPTWDAMARNQFSRLLENTLDEIEGGLSPEERGKLSEDIAPIKAFAAEYVPQKSKWTSLVIFSDASEKFFWVHGFRIPFETRAVWEETVYLKPLLEALHEYERYGVVIADRRKARLLTVYLGEIEEEQDAFAKGSIQHQTTTATDNPRSQMNIERKSEEHAVWHFKHVAQMLEEISARREFHHLILAGPVEVTRHLFDYLPKTLKERVIAMPHLPVTTKENEILKTTRDVEKNTQRAEAFSMFLLRWGNPTGSGFS